MTANPVPGPTKADLKRDLEADLGLVCDPVLQASAVENRTYFERHNCWPDTPWMAFPLVAFDGWPAAIRRALWAEAEVERLKRKLDEELANHREERAVLTNISKSLLRMLNEAEAETVRLRQTIKETLKPKEGT